MIGEYHKFLERKAQVGSATGFRPTFFPNGMFPFQEELVGWAVRQGRCALFEDCGLGKTVQQLAWAQNVVEHTNRPVLVLTPLAVAAQTVSEAEKFGIGARRSSDGEVAADITVANYERLHYFDPSAFAGVVCDESSILKNFNGVRRQQITDFLRKMQYRLLCTATAAPNDFHELGTSSEALGFLGYMDMLGKFFKADDGKGSAATRSYGKQVKFRLKGHAEEGFWRWVCSWARAIRRPSDLGHEDGDFILPPIVEREWVVESRTLPPGMLFPVAAVSLHEQREEQRRTIEERCEKVAELVDHSEPALVWCQLNDEGDLLERLIPDSVQVAGSDSSDAKEEKLLGFASGDYRVLVTKPKIGAWGLNFQHCAHVTFFPSHSFEQFYQGVRRCWRFGQESEVLVDVVTTEGGRGVLKNLQEKQHRAEEMFSQLVRHMEDALRIDRAVQYNREIEVPQWAC